MGYTSGHYRKGHFRNGKWISGGYVRGHYRGGYGYSSALYSIDSSSSESITTDKPNITNDIEIKDACNEDLYTSETYLNNRREYWRKEAEKDRINKNKHKNNYKAPNAANTSKPKNLTGEAYLNSQREYWRKEIDKDPDSFRMVNNKSSDETGNSLILKAIIGGFIIAALVIWLEPVLTWIIALAVIFRLKFWR